jgi:hypothetical protein
VEERQALEERMVEQAQEGVLGQAVVGDRREVVEPMVERVG